MLAASRDLGPRVIALLTAKLIVRDRPPIEAEELVLLAAEQLSDHELTSFADFMRSPPKQITRKGYNRFEVQREYERDSVLPFMPMTAPNLREILGSWAPKLMRLGMIMQYIEEVTHPTKDDGSEEQPHKLPRREMTWEIDLSAESCRQLALLVERASRSASSGAPEPKDTSDPVEP